MKILLVDDEPKLLDSLSRYLWVDRPQWEVNTVSSGEEAIQLLGGNAYDILVTDMMMPGMDGGALLKQAKQVSPGTVRLVLSGHAGRDLIHSSEVDFHQFLGKPVDPDRFIAMLDSFDLDHARPETVRARALVSGIARVPSLPRIHQELASYLEIGAPLGEIEILIRQDLGLASKVLKLVNSSYLTVNERVTDLSLAVQLLSHDLIRRAVLVNGATETAHSLQPSGLDLEDLWRESLAIANATRFLAEAMGQTRSVVESCYTVGLLHDVGMAVLAEDPAFGYQDLLNRHHALGAPLVEIEREAFGTDHAEIGAELLHLWGLDTALCEVIRNHHRNMADSKAFSMQMALGLAHNSNFESRSPSAFGDGASLKFKSSPPGVTVAGECASELNDPPTGLPPLQP